MRDCGTMTTDISDQAWLRGRRLANSVVVAGCLLICLRAALLLAHVAVVSACSAGLIDFAQEWTSARNYAIGQPVYLDFGRSLAIHFGPASAAHFQYNAHPPASVLLALPFALLPYRPAFLTWSVLSAACLVASLLMVLRNRRGQPIDLPLLAAITLVMTSSVLVQQTIQGQLNLVLLVLITGAWLADRKDASAISGVLIGIAAAIKLFPAFLVLYYLAQRKWRAVWGVAVAFLAVNGLGCLLFGVQAYRDYFLRVAPDVAKFRDTWPNASLLGFWSKLFDGGFGQVVPLWHCPILAQSLTVISCLVLVAATAWSVARTARPAGGPPANAADQNLAFALCCTGMLLASPITWDHYFLLLIPALWFAWQGCQGHIVSRTLIVIVAIALLWMNPSSIWAATIPDQFGTNGQARVAGAICTLTLISIQFYALLGFYLLVFAKLRQATSQPRSP
jgi:hypothetical protein